MESGNEDVKIVFSSCLRQKWTDFRQTKTRMINGPFYTCRLIHFINGNDSCFW